MRVLVCEDDTNLRKGLLKILSEEGYETLEAADGLQAMKLFALNSPDFVCLDIMLPGLGGYEVCKRIRKTSPSVPIMFISARGEEVDKVLGLELGGDDYVTKPFAMKEVVARIRAITRRCYRAHDLSFPSFYFADLLIEPQELYAYRGEERIELSLRDVKLLSLLERNKGRIVSREIIFEQCWEMGYQPTSRTLDQHISKLRKKLSPYLKESINGETCKNDYPIETIHGVGYRYRLSK